MKKNNQLSVEHLQIRHNMTSRLLKNYLRCNCGVKIGSKCSCITYTLRFFANFRLALAAWPTFFSSVLVKSIVAQRNCRPITALKLRAVDFP